MHDAVELVGLLLLAELAVGLAVGLLLWRRFRGRSAAAPAPLATPAPPAPTPKPTPKPAPAPLPPQPPTIAAPPAAPEPAPAVALPDDPDPELEDETVIEDARAVIPTTMTLVWGRLGAPPERYSVRIDSISRDMLVFGGDAKRLDVIQIVPSRRLFHTMRLPHERLLAAHTSDDQPIDDIRSWLAGLPDVEA